MSAKSLKWICIIFFVLLGTNSSFAQTETGPLILQEMTWPDVAEYLKTSDMIIIPLGSTEQHGPHLPLGTDFYESFEITKEISRQSGVVVAPILFVGYSKYHSGFPGTLSLKPKTMEAVIYDCVETLLGYGFKKFMFFNYHGGNNIVQENLIHRINHSTEAIAVAIGHGGPIQQGGEEEEFFDWHAGKNETSIMLYLKPDLVKLERAGKPDIRFTAQMEKLKSLADKHPDLIHVWTSLFGTPVETNKGGASHELSSNGVWSFSDPKSATREIGKSTVDPMIDRAVKFINAWKLAGN